MTRDEPDPTGALMLFDGLCGFCDGSVRFVLARSRGSALRFCAMQSPPGQAWLRRLGRPSDAFPSFILIDGGSAYERSAALLRLARYMDAPWPLLARALACLPARWRDRAYDWIAANRYRFAGRRTDCALPNPAERARFVTTLDEAAGPEPSG